MFNSYNNNASDYEDIKDNKIFTYFGLSPLQTKTYTYKFTTSFKGEYLHPGFRCEAMYAAAKYAQIKGKTMGIY